MTHLIIVMALWTKYILPKQGFSTEDFTVDVPCCLLQILDSFVLEIRSPDVFHSVAQTEVHVFGDLDALHF